MSFPMLNPDLYFFCKARKNPHIVKIRECCSPRKCPMLGTKPRKNPARTPAP